MRRRIGGRPPGRTERSRAAAARALRRHWLLALGALSLGGMVVAVNPGALLGALEAVRPPLLLLMLPVTLGSYAARGLAWRSALRAIGVRVSTSRAVRIMVAGQVLIFLPAGDLGRVALLRESGASGRSAGELAGTIAFQELVYLTIMGAAVIPAAFEHPAYGAVAALLVLVQVGIAGVLLWRPAFRRALAAVGRVRPLRHLESEVHDLRDAFLRCLAPGPAARVTGFGVVAAGSSFLLFEMALQAVGITRVGWADALFIFAIGHILAAVSMLPGGLGVYEGVLTGFLALTGVAPSEGAAAALVYRGYNDVLMALVGAAAGYRLRRPRSRRFTGGPEAQPGR